MDIRFERGLRKENAILLCEWSNDRGENFQEQWMGLKISYPLTYDKSTCFFFLIRSLMR